MNNQEAFDKAVTHLFTQRAYAQSIDGECQYKTESGLQCAVGCLIPDNEYQSWFEGREASTIAHNVPTLSGVSTDLLRTLQIIHDSRELGEWFEGLERLASRFGLEAAILNTFSEVQL